MIADECVLGRGSQIRAGVKIWPSKTVEPGSTVNELVIWAGEWRQRAVLVVRARRPDQRRAHTGVLRTARRRVRRDAGQGRVRRRRPGPRALVAHDQARDRQRHRQCGCEGARRARAAGAGDAVGNAATPIARRASTCSLSPLDQRSADIRFFDSEGLQIDKRAERKLENLLFREDFRRAGFYEMGDIEYGEPIPGVHRASAQVGGRGPDPQRGVPRAHRLRLQRRVSGAPGDPQRARGHDDPAQRRDARGRTPSGRARRDGADQQDGARRRRLHDQPDRRAHHAHRRQGRGA